MIRRAVRPVAAYARSVSRPLARAAGTQPAWRKWFAGSGAWWPVKLIVGASVLFAGLKTVPLVELHAAQNAMVLCKSKDDFLARSGIRRALRAAKSSDKNRIELFEHGFCKIAAMRVSALESDDIANENAVASARDAVEALTELAQNPQLRDGLAADESVASVLSSQHEQLADALARLVLHICQSESAASTLANRAWPPSIQGAHAGKLGAEARALLENATAHG